MQEIELNQSIDEQWMQLALVQAKLAEAQGEVPVGAVIASESSHRSGI